MGVEIRPRQAHDWQLLAAMVNSRARRLPYRDRLSFKIQATFYSACIDYLSGIVSEDQKFTGKVLIVQRLKHGMSKILRLDFLLILFRHID